MEEMHGWLTTGKKWKRFNVNEHNTGILGKEELNGKTKDWDSEKWKEEMMERSSLWIYRQWKEDIGEMDSLYENRPASIILLQVRTNSLPLQERRWFQEDI